MDHNQRQTLQRLGWIFIRPPDCEMTERISAGMLHGTANSGDDSGLSMAPCGRLQVDIAADALSSVAR
jgi:hypothetical protein